jgi:hypothetical protein
LTYPKHQIEVDLPLKAISALHIWWAHHPLEDCRAVLALHCGRTWPLSFSPIQNPACLSNRKSKFAFEL